MQDRRTQNYGALSAAHTPRESNSNYNLSYSQYSPSLQKSRTTKDTTPTERPKSNKVRNPADNHSGSKKQVEVMNSTMQRLLMDRNTNNLAGSFYNVGGKTRDREKSGLANMFKPKESEKEVYKDSNRESPAKRPMKYTTSQREIKLNENKDMMFEIVPLKSYRRVEGEFKLGDMTSRPTSRQKSGSIHEKEATPSKSSHHTNATPQRYFNSSNDRSKQKSISHLVDSTPSHSESVIKKSHKVLELDHDRQSFAASLYHSRVSPAGHQESSGVRPFEYIPLNGSKGYKTTSRQAESGQVTERRDNGANKKLHRRGLSIDQISNLGIIDKAQTSRRVEKGSRNSREEIMMAASPTERRLTASRIAEQQQQQMLLQQQQLELQHKQLKQQLKQQLEQQQLNQQQQSSQQQQQQIVIVNNEADQIKYFEKLLHIDKMTFDFEKQMVLRRQKKQQQIQQQPPQPTPIMTTTANTKHTMHSRTRSMEEQPSLQQTKSSSRWNTKRSRNEDGLLMGDDTVELPEGQEAFRPF